MVRPNGKEALGVNYERHYWCRPGYNYKNIKNEKWNVPIHPEDGIFRINLDSGKFKLIIKTQEIVNFAPNIKITNANNWLEHMMYSPSGNRFMFLHRWYNEGKDHTRLFTANYDGSDIFMFGDVRFYSHSDWKNDNELTIWTKELNSSSNRRNTEILFTSINKFKTIQNTLKILYKSLKPIFPITLRNKILPQSKLINFKDKTLEYNIIGNGVLFGNGHNSWSKNRKFILIDTYEDKNNYRHLMLYSVKKNKIIKVGKFYSNYNRCVYRADLHPRFSFDNQRIVIDSAHVKKRKIIVIEKDNER